MATLGANAGIWLPTYYSLQTSNVKPHPRFFLCDVCLSNHPKNAQTNDAVNLFLDTIQFTMSHVIAKTSCCDIPTVGPNNTWHKSYFISFALYCSIVADNIPQPLITNLRGSEQFQGSFTLHSSLNAGGDGEVLESYYNYSLHLVDVDIRHANIQSWKAMRKTNRQLRVTSASLNKGPVLLIDGYTGVEKVQRATCWTYSVLVTQTFISLLTPSRI